MRDVGCLRALVATAALAAALPGCGRTDLLVCGRPSRSVSGTRPIAPLSTSFVSSHRPRLSWALIGVAIGAHVEVCRDPGCERLVEAFDATGTSGQPARPLAPGTYFWRLFALLPAGRGCEPSPTWELVVTARDAPVQTSRGAILDVDRDGRPDLAFSASNVARGTGRVLVFLGSDEGFVTPPASVISGADGGGFYYGGHVIDAGDVNGDGFSELAVRGSTPDNRVGRIELYAGSPEGLLPIPVQLVEAPVGAPDRDDFAFALSGIGDVDGDGYADIAASDSEGNVYVCFGGPMGLRVSSTPLPQPPRYRRDGAWPEVASAGDVDGDGFADVIVGFPQGSRGPLAFVYAGGPGGIVDGPIATLSTSVEVDPLFSGLVGEIGDVNGDGYSDVAVTYMAADPRQDGALVYLGGPSGPSAEPDLELRPLSGLPALPRSAGDLDGDGLDEAMMAADGYGAFNAAIIWGAEEGIGERVEPYFMPGSFDQASTSVGDVDGDGIPDYALVAAATNTILVHRMTMDGLSGEVIASIPGPDRETSPYALSLVGVGY